VATAVVRVDPVAPDERVVREAADVLRRGGLVAFPTETFYGLGAAALDAAAVRRVFEVKGRPSSMPLLVLVDSAARLRHVTMEVPERARALMDRHWPGALTLVFRAAPQLPAELTAGTGTVGVRVPNHRVARALVSQLGLPVTAPSANPTGGDPPTTADGVLAYFRDVLDLVLDGGPTPGGAPSTVVDVTVDPPRVLRQGAVTLEPW
jgi:L-threonylcarbamoyladenylate synthase